MRFTTVEIPSSFIGDFAVGDEIVADSRRLCALCEKGLGPELNKVRYIWCAAILEACLQQIIYRAQKFTREGVQEISERDLEDIRGQKIDKLNNIIAVMDRRKILGDGKNGVYEKLHGVRKMRNRIHIQEREKLSEPRLRDSRLFSNDRLKDALELTASTLKYLNDRYPRSVGDHVKPIRLPVVAE